MSPLKTAALALAAKGMRIFPCVERGKEPAIADNLKRATTDPNIIAGWWRSRDFNIGIATGPDSGIWVLDIDGAEGEALIRQHEAEHGIALPPTVEVITTDGRHLYFRWPAGCEIRNKQDDPIMPEIDVRGEGGYVLAPPSIHPISGRRYAWSVDSADSFADAPDWLIELIITKSNVVPITAPETWRSFISEPVEGSHRGHAVARLYGLLVRRFLDPLVALDIARMFNALRCKPPLDDADVVRIVDAIARREADRREAQ
jgi:Bifunctional DNA primase/polymerase, N-terminal